MNKAWTEGVDEARVLDMELIPVVTVCLETGFSP
jgi:hypothetical protein